MENTPPPPLLHQPKKLGINRVTQFKNNLFLIIFWRNSLAHGGEKVAVSKIQFLFFPPRIDCLTLNGIMCVFVTFTLFDMGFLGPSVMEGVGP